MILLSVGIIISKRLQCSKTYVNVLILKISLLQLQYGFSARNDQCHQLYLLYVFQTNMLLCLTNVDSLILFPVVIFFLQSISKTQLAVNGNFNNNNHVFDKSNFVNANVYSHNYCFLPGGEVLVTCQMHQSHQNLSSSTSIASNIGQDNKPPPLPPKKKHSKFYCVLRSTCIESTNNLDYIHQVTSFPLAVSTNTLEYTHLFEN